MVKGRGRPSKLETETAMEIAEAMVAIERDPMAWMELDGGTVRGEGLWRQVLVRMGVKRPPPKDQRNAWSLFRKNSRKDGKGRGVYVRHVDKLYMPVMKQLSSFVDSFLQARWKA